MTDKPQGITLEPNIETLVQNVDKMDYVAFCGLNNSGKSVILKQFKKHYGKSAYLINPQRFYHIYHIGTRDQNKSVYDQIHNEFNSHANDVRHNHEQNHMSLEMIIGSMNDTNRANLLKLCGELLGSKITMNKVDENNELSMRYIDIDGYNVSLGSTGTRLVLTLLGICLDSNFDVVLIDEPELGLGPRIQQNLCTFFSQMQSHREYFGHLKRMIVATHSHLFLNRKDITYNYIVQREKNTANISRVASISEFNRLQFNLLGNTFESMFLPSAFIVAEGKTDKAYIETLTMKRFPDKNIVTISSEGDPKRKIHSLKEVLGNISKSPFHGRVIVVLDSVTSHPTLEKELEQMGIESHNIAKLSLNGIEFFYPTSIMAKLFSCVESDLQNLCIRGDMVSLNGVEFRKSELSSNVCSQITGGETLPQELEEKLFDRLKAAIE